MTPDQIDRAATLLAHARLTKSGIPPLPEQCQPKTLDDGYAIQDAVAARVGIPVGGWKVGLTSPAAQKRRSVQHPITGRVYLPTIFQEKVEIKGKPPMLCLEGELAFKLGSDLPARAAPYTHDDIDQAIESMFPAFEICVSHYTDWAAQHVASIIADNSASIGLVIGKPILGWRDLDLSAIPVRIRVDGEELCKGSGAEVMGGDPLASIVFLANLRSARGDGLRKGQIVTTGTMHGAPVVRTDAHCEADFGAYGTLSFHFTD